MSPLTRIAVLLAAPLVCHVPSARASAYYFLDSGARSIGRGGAFVVGADDMTAQYYNPAALRNIRRPIFNLNGWAITQHVGFDRADEAGEEPFEEVFNESPPIYEPSGGFAMPLPFLPRARVALGMYVPSSPYMAYPDDGAQRYTIQNSLIWQVYAGPSASYDVTDWLTLGAGLQYTFLRVEQQLTVTTVPDGSDDPTNDISLDLKTWDKSKFAWNAGFLVRPTPWLEIGGSVQPPISYEAPGTLKATFAEDHPLKQFIEGEEFTDDDVLLHVAVPLIVRAGVQVAPVQKAKVEADFTWTRWSTLSELRVTELDMRIPANPDAPFPLDWEEAVVTDDVIFPTGYQDSISVRVGGDYEVTPWAKARAGAHYESSAVPPELQGAGVVDGSKWGVGGGGTFTIAERVALDVGVAGQFLADRHIEDSDLRQTTLVVDPLDGSSVVGTGKVVGNGDIESSILFVAVGATVYFGEAPPR